MRVDWEITGEAKGVHNNVFRVELFLNSSSVGFLNMNLLTEKVYSSLDFEEGSTIFDFLDIAENYRGYKAFLNLLGIEIPEFCFERWTPTKNSAVYVILDSEIERASSDSAEIKKACLHYNVFPGLELAERAINLSKLDRLILLWQYKNNCLFTPNWKNIDQPKHSVIYVEMYKELRADTIYTVREHKTYFETEEQVEAFIKVYDKEIKKIMGVI